MIPTEDDIILFRFHKSPQICKQRVEQLKTKLKTDVDIYGVGENIFTTNQEQQLFENVYYPSPSERNCWLHGDLMLTEWFKEVGQKIDFQNVILLEWDVLLNQPLQEILPKSPRDNIVFCNYKKLQGHTYNWLSGRQHEIDYLRNYFKTHFSVESMSPLKIGFLPLSVFPKKFINEYVNSNPPKIGNDELKLSIAAQASDHQITSIELQKDTFNVENKGIETNKIKTSGSKLIHPVKNSVD